MDEHTLVVYIENLELHREQRGYLEDDEEDGLAAAYSLLFDIRNGGLFPDDDVEELNNDY